ncbi:MAG: GxxExxY protein [Bacteroidota bacterium]
MFEPVDDRTDELASIIVDSAFKVYSELGPGLLESIYETCLCHELKKRNIPYERQVSVPVVYDGMTMETGFRIDIVVDNTIIVEIKAVDEMHSVYQAQILTYLKLAKKRLGLLINFNVPTFKRGIRRIIL